MKTIMFNDRYWLTAAVLHGEKTQTRRNSCRYNVGEVVAIAQNYKDAGVRFVQEEDKEFGCYDFPAEQTKGWNNKMFVKADLMPHHIRITAVRQERLQDISDEDCLKEGIEWLPDCRGFKPYAFYDTEIHIKNDKEEGYGWYVDFNTPREAYAALIDRLNGKGTWASNPIVWVYDFELLD